MASAIGASVTAVLWQEEGFALAALDDAHWHAGDGYACVVDGIFYNLSELAPDRPGANEAEALVLAISRMGVTEALKLANGDFAAALYDRRRRLILARDRFGIRPLYLTREEAGREIGGPAFASRPRALLPLPGVSREPDRRTLAAMIGANYRYFDVEPCRAPYRDLEQVPAATALVISDFSDRRTEVYEDFTPGPRHREPVEELAEAYRDLFRDSVGRRLRRFRNPAFTLSGGLDSSSVTITASRIAEAPVVATSSTYDDRQYDESEEINDVVATGSCTWKPVRLAPGDLFGDIAKLIAAHDEPVSTVTWLSHAELVNRMVEDGHDVVFSGLGGDEQHAGEYDYFFYAFADLAAQGDDDRLNHEIAAWARNHDHPIHRKNAAVAKRMMGLLTNPAQPGQCLPNPYLRQRYRHLLSGDLRDVDLSVTLPRWSESYLTSHTLNELLRNTMPCCLRAADRNGRLAGIEGCHPFHDHRLLHFMLRLPPTEKIQEGVTKCFLRRAMSGVLPEVTRTRVKKTGWNAPAHRWFAEDFHDALLDMTGSRRFRERGLVDVPAVEAMAGEHRRIVLQGEARDNHMMALWQIANLEIWLRDLEDWKPPVECP